MVARSASAGSPETPTPSATGRGGARLPLLLECRRLQHGAQGDDPRRVVRHLDADDRLPRHRRLDAERGRAASASARSFWRAVMRETRIRVRAVSTERVRGAPDSSSTGCPWASRSRHRAGANVPSGLHAELRHGRALVDLHHRGVDSERGERLDDELGAPRVVARRVSRKTAASSSRESGGSCQPSPECRHSPAGRSRSITICVGGDSRFSSAGGARSSTAGVPARGVESSVGSGGPASSLIEEGWLTGARSSAGGPGWTEATSARSNDGKRPTAPPSARTPRQARRSSLHRQSERAAAAAGARARAGRAGWPSAARAARTPPADRGARGGRRGQVVSERPSAPPVEAASRSTPSTVKRGPPHPEQPPAEEEHQERSQHVTAAAPERAAEPRPAPPEQESTMPAMPASRARVAWCTPRTPSASARRSTRGGGERDSRRGSARPPRGSGPTAPAHRRPRHEPADGQDVGRGGSDAVGGAAPLRGFARVGHLDISGRRTPPPGRGERPLR